MKKTVELYISHLFEINRKEMHQLDEEDIQVLTSLLIKETPIKHLPMFEQYDKQGEVMNMMAEWMDDQSNDMLGFQILETMRDHITTAMLPMVENRMRDYAIREAQAERIAKSDREHANFEYERSRI